MNLELNSNKMIADCLKACVEAGYFRPVNLDLMTYRIVLLAHGWALKHWHFKRTTTLDEYIREGLDLFQHGLLTEKGWQHWRVLSGQHRPPMQQGTKVRIPRRRSSKGR
jgi:hypothetical protein